MEVIVCLFALGATCVLMPVALRLSAVLGAVDVPDGGRKQHAAPTPRLGGLPILIACLASAVWLLPTDTRTHALLSCGTVLYAAGLADDVRPLPAPLKLALQLLVSAAALLTVGTPRALSFFGATLPLGEVLSFGMCLLLTVTLINAVNCIDGLDGEAASVLTVGLLALSPLLYGAKDAGGGVLCLVTVASLLGFLAYNRTPAVVFMGDGGSQVLGLWTALLLLGDGGGALPLSRLWLFVVPIADLLRCAVLRLWHGRSPLRADRTHVHHLLVHRGVSPQATVLWITLLSACGALIGYGLGA